MKHRLLADDAGELTFILVLDEGDDFECITAFVEKEEVTAASITAIGAFRVPTIAFFDFQAKGGQGGYRPTLEVVLRETPVGLLRRNRVDLGIALIDVG